jgi:hypothetical protein
MKRQFVSYPKSGRTWIRFILSQLDCDQLIHFHHDRFEFNDGSRPPHDFNTLSRLEQYAENEKLVYLERDPRDVMVSLYHQITGRFSDFFQYRGDLSEFIRDDYFGATNLKKFRDMWDVILSQRGFLKITYESCHLNTDRMLQQVLSYYQLEVSQNQLSEAVSRGSFESMKRIEASMEFAEPWLRIRSGSPKVRQGKIGGFRGGVSTADIEYLNEVFGLLP